MTSSSRLKTSVGESDTNRHPPITSDRSTKIHRTEIRPEFIRERSSIGASSGKTLENGNQKLTKLLVHVTIQRSLGPVQVMTSPEKTVDELIKAAVQIYVKEKRRPFLTETDPRCFELHYSQFCLESLSREEKLINLGSRNFFLCLKLTVAVKASSSSSTCSNEANMKLQGGSNKSHFVWTRFMDFLL